MSPAKIVVVGAGYAGVLAAQRLARRTGARAEVTLVNASEDFVERIRLHELAAGRPPPRRPIAALLRGTGAALRIGRVVGIDLDRRRVGIEDGGGPTWAPVDYLVLAAGSTTGTPVAGVAEHAYRLDVPASAAELGRAARTAAARGAPLVVVGGGLTAIEAATELADATPGLAVVLVCRGRVGEGVLGADAVAHVGDALARRGVEVLENTEVIAVVPGFVVTARERLPAGAVLWAAGFVASPLAAAAGLAVDQVGRMLVDAMLAAPAAPWIFGAGDAAVPRAPVGAPIAMSCKAAMPMGAHVADNLAALVAGGAPRRFGFGDSLVCVSLGRRDAVIQRRDRAGGNRGVIRGRAGAWIKEGICRLTVGALAMTRRWAGVYRWPSAPAVPGAPAALADARWPALPVGDELP